MPSANVALGDYAPARGAFARLLAVDSDYTLDETRVPPKILEQFRAARLEHVGALFEEGKKAYFARDCPKAEERMSRILRMDPEHSLANEHAAPAAEQAALREREASLEQRSEAGGAASSAGAGGPRLPLTSRISRPILISRVQPEYPGPERRRRKEGTVVLSAVIERDGTVRDPKVIRSVRPGLDAAALEALRSRRYRPALLEGQPVAI